MTEFDKSRAAAINLCKRNGERIAQDYPEIANDYAGGKTAERKKAASFQGSLK